jgi:RecA/RadA recombinase
MYPQWISTGIRELDTLLGKGPPPLGQDPFPDDDGDGIRQGNVVLIRGEPGSGKTTLGLQVLSKYLSQQDNKAILFSLEENASQLLKRMDASFNFHLQEKRENNLLYCVNAQEVIEKLAIAIGSVQKEIDQAMTDGLKSGTSFSTLALVFKVVCEKIADALVPEATWQNELKKGSLLILIDSIDAFMGALKQVVRIDEPRVLLKTACDYLRNGGREPSAKTGDMANTLLLMSEYHYHSPTPTPAFTDSFYCDVEILLRPEPVCVPEDYEQHIQAPVGYSLNTLIRAEAKSIESRSFCRVLKSRATSNQSRRCAYDIVPNKGVQFFETYPGDGKLVLFAENEPQRTAWASFFRHDVPDSYPALRHEVFDRMSMQTVFEGQRRLTNIPLKTDMYLASFDSYWIGWYRSLKFKCDLHNALEQLLDPAQQQRKEYCHFVNSLSRAFLAALPDIRGASPNESQREDDAGRVCEEMTKAADLDKFRQFLTSYAPRSLAVLSSTKTGSLDSKVEGLVRDLLQSPTAFARDYSCFLERLPFRKLRLFGEKRSRILPELTEAMESFRGNKWVKEACKEGAESEWLSIPYDANIGIFVYRKDILHGSRNKLSREKVEARLTELVDREKQVMRDLYERLVDPHSVKKMEYADARKGSSTQDSLIKELNEKLPYCVLPDSSGNAGTYDECVAKMVKWAADRILGGEEPKTWEEVIVQCQMLDKKLLIETQTFDSYICTLLEMLWNSGGNLRVRHDYTVEDKHKLYVPLLRALHLVDSLFDSGIVDRNSTVSAPLRASRDLADDWLYARHWYSTLIEYLTSKNAAGEYQAKLPAEAALEIMPMPVSLSLWAEQLYELKDNNKSLQESLLNCPKPYQFIIECDPASSDGGGVDQTRQCPHLDKKRPCAKKAGFEDLLRTGPKHHSCWGDWSLGLLSGSENCTLAVDLINNMMGSIKITSRAFAGACLPTVTEFYGMFGDIPCVYLPERTDIGLPSFTYDELRAEIYAHAKTRSDVYDFMHCAKILNGQIEFLRRTKDPEEKKRNTGLVGRCIKIIDEIEELYNESILVPYRDG